MTTRRALCATFLALSVTASSGCATIMNGTHQSVFFDSVPPGAEIKYDGRVYTTPCLISLAKYYDGIKLPIYKSGFAPQEIECKVKMGGWIWGNILFGGIPGIIIDDITAAHLDYTEENHKAILLPVDEISARGYDEARAEKRRQWEDHYMTKRHRNE